MDTTTKNGVTGIVSQGEDNGALVQVRNNEEIPYQKLILELKFVANYVMNNINREVSCQWMYKKMPATARCLEDGSLSKDKIRKWLIDVFKHTFPPPSAGAQVDLDILRIAKRVIPKNTGFADEIKSEEVKKFGEVLTKAIIGLYDEESIAFRPASSLSYLDWMELYKRAVDITCEALAPRLDSTFYRGREGRFLQRCPVYHKPARYFGTIVRDESKKRDIYPLKKAQQYWERRWTAISILELAFDEIEQGGLFHVNRTCWECDSRTTSGSRCSACGVALYCARNCQKKSWRAGHQHACPHLKNISDEFERSLAHVVATHDREIGQNIIPAFDLDFKALDHCLSGDNPWRGSLVYRDGYLTQPSIECYYNNLRRVMEGRIWFFSYEESRVDYQKRLWTTQDHEQAEDELLSKLLVLLCYDYDGAFHLGGIPEDHYDRAFATAVTNCGVMLDLDKDGLRMPAFRFIELFNKYRYFKGTVKETRAFRRQKKNESVKRFLCKQKIESHIHVGQNPS